MPAVQRSVVTLRIIGDLLVPEDISARLGAKPTSSHAKGETVVNSGGRARIARTGQWHLEAQPTEPVDFDAQVDEILLQLTSDLSTWDQLQKEFSIDLFCGWFMGETNEGEEISAATLLRLGQRGIRLGIDIYGPGVGV